MSSRQSQFLSIQRELNSNPIAPPEGVTALLEWAYEKGHTLLATTNLSIRVAFEETEDFENALEELYTVMRTLTALWAKCPEERLDTELFKMFVRKNSDYGDAFMEYGAVGCVIRLTDKLKRLKTLTSGSTSLVTDESIHDTMKDAVNYIILTFITLRHSSDQ